MSAVSDPDATVGDLAVATDAIVGDAPSATTPTRRTHPTAGRRGPRPHGCGESSAGPCRSAARS